MVVSPGLRGGIKVISLVHKNFCSHFLFQKKNKRYVKEFFFFVLTFRSAYKTSLEHSPKNVSSYSNKSAHFTIFISKHTVSRCIPKLFMQVCFFPLLFCDKRLTESHFHRIITNKYLGSLTCFLF